MRSVKLIFILTCCALIQTSTTVNSGKLIQNSSSRNPRWLTYHSRAERSPAKNRQKEVDQQLKMISKLMTNLRKTRGCSTAKTDLESHCKDHWISEALLRLSVRIASRNNKDATKREKQIHNQHIKINKLMEKMNDVADCDAGNKLKSVTTSKDSKLKQSEKDTKIEDLEKKDGGEDYYTTESTTGDVDSSEGSGDNSTEDATSEGYENVTQKPDGDESDCDYSHFEDSHTMLLPPSDCKIHKTGVTEEDKRDILRFHNVLRARVARGEETGGNPGPQPPAADMRELVWNDQLAEVAEAWAKQCQANHDQPGARKICSRNYHIGQNLHFYYGYATEVSWEDAVNHWYEEVEDFPNDLVASFRSLQPIKIGHYTQVVWADTTEVGCGIVHYETELNGKLVPESKIYACNYGKAGNVKTLPIYTEGATGSKCPLGPSPNYSDLCAPDTQKQ